MMGRDTYLPQPRDRSQLGSKRRCSGLGSERIAPAVPGCYSALLCIEACHSLLLPLSYSSSSPSRASVLLTLRYIVILFLISTEKFLSTRTQKLHYRTGRCLVHHPPLLFIDQSFRPSSAYHLPRLKLPSLVFEPLSNRDATPSHALACNSRHCGSVFRKQRLKLHEPAMGVA